MERDRLLNPEEIGAQVADLIRGIQDRSFAEQVGPAERGRLRPATDQERRARDEEALRRDAAERRRRVVHSTLSHVIPPKEFLIITGSARQTDASKMALDWWDDRRSRVLVLSGGRGVGKTLASALVAKHAVEGGKRSISWHRPDDFVSGMLHSYDDTAPAIGRDLVILDDMGRETKASFQEALTSFLDSRLTPMIITTNDTLLTWEQRYDPRLMDRLSDEGERFVIAGDSMRQRGIGFTP